VGTSTRLMCVGRCVGSGIPDGAHRLLADPFAEVDVEVEEVADQASQPREAVVENCLLDTVDAALVDPRGVVGGLGKGGGQGFNEHETFEPVGAVDANVAGHFAGPEREPNESRVVEIERGEHSVEVGREGVEVVAAGRTARSAEAAAVVGDDPVTGREQREQLRLPGTAVQRPAVQQDDGWTTAVVFVVDLDRGRVLPADGDGAHGGLLGEWSVDSTILLDLAPSGYTADRRKFPAIPTLRGVPRCEYGRGGSHCARRR
jgi:hypothetical protein